MTNNEILDTLFLSIFQQKLGIDQQGQALYNLRLADDGVISINELFIQLVNIGMDLDEVRSSLGPSDDELMRRFG